MRRLVWAGVLSATFPIAWWFQPQIVEDRIPICFFRIVTSRPCPFCGLTRAFAHATHGEFRSAFECHPLWPLAALVIALLAFLLVMDACTDADYFPRFISRVDRLIVPVVVGLIGFGLWRVLQ